MMRDRDIMDIFSKFSSGLSAIVILFAVIPQTSCTPKDSLEETFLQFVDYWKNNNCLFPSSAIFENVMFPNAFPLKACSNEIAMQGVESDQFTKTFGVALCFEFFNKSKELCHAENLQPESLAQLTSNASWDVCASANEVFGNDGKKDGEFRPTIMTSYMDICHNQCAENKAIAPVCRLLVAAVMKYEEHRATGHDESTDSTGNNGNKDSDDGSKDKDNSENVTANTNVGNTGNNGSKDSDKKDNDDNKDNTDDDKNDDGNTDELEHQAGKASGVELPGIERDSSSVSFFVIFIIVVVVILAAYALFHKRKAIIAFIVEGSETQSSRADNKKVKYGKLKPSADEELPYLDRSLTTHNYIY